MMRRIPIFFTFDDNYTVPAAVAFFSLLNRASANVAYDMYVLHHDISEEHQALLRSVVGRFASATLAFRDTAGFLKDEWARGNWDGNQNGVRFSSDAVVRCFAARFFPEYEKIVYSDVDVVFVDDVSELWDVDLDDAYMAGVRNVFLKSLPTMLSHLKPEHHRLLDDIYIDGGLWVMNLRKIREDRLEDRMLGIIRDDSIVKRWNDMDVMNIACAGKVAFLPLNYIARPHLAEAVRKPGFASHFTRDEIYDAILRPKILHYAGTKPWLTKMNWDSAWWDIADYLGLDARRPSANGEALPVVNAALQREKRARRLWRLAFFVALATVCILCLCVIP